MALRIGGGKKMPPVDEKMDAPEQAPVTETNAADEGDVSAEEQSPDEATDPAAEEAPEGDPTMDAQGGGGLLNPVSAGYKGPEMGPFMCANCEYFSQTAPNTCAIVAGPIDEAGICNVFTPLSAGQHELPPEEAGPEAMPEEPPAEPAPEEQPTEEQPPAY